MAAVVFTNPATSATYSWPRNPSSEQSAAKARSIERTSNTGNVGAVKQQGDEGSLILDWSIICQTRAMEVALLTWYETCKGQTIYVTDWDGEQYEVQIIAASRQRVPSGGSTGEYAVYDLQLEVYAFLSGVWHDAGVTP